MHTAHFEQKNSKNTAFILMGGFSLMSLQLSGPIPLGQHCLGPCRSYVSILSWSYHSQNQMYSY